MNVSALKNPNTDWMPGAVGAFMHWWPEAATTDKWKEFNVTALKDQLVDAGVDFFILTLGQNSNYYNAPNEEYERLAGYDSGSCCSPRDIPGEIIAALKGTGIRFGLYSPCQPSFRDAEAETRFGFTLRDGPNTDYQATDEGVRNWCKVLKCWSDRYPNEISIWWFDGAYRAIGYKDEHGDWMRDAIRKANPDVVMAFNDGSADWGTYAAWNKMCRGDRHYAENHPLRTWPYAGDGTTKAVQRIGLSASDYNAGETEEPMRFMPDNRWIDDRQYFILSYIGPYWGQGPCRYPDDLWIPWLREYRKHGGCICFDMASDHSIPNVTTGTFAFDQIDQLRRLIRATAPE